MSDDNRVLCRRCGRPIVADPGLSHHVFEGMHWLCFHLEYEHEGDPDLPCNDPSCRVWRLEVYESKLRELGLEPSDVLGAAVEKRFGPR